MFDNEDALKLRVGHNITYYRELAGDTQLQLAEKLNYSDKSVSKWERGEGIPSIYVLTCIAEFYGITVNDLLAEKPPVPHKARVYNHFIITMLSFGLVWLVTTLIYIILRLAAPNFEGAWLFFLYAVPVNAIVSIVLSFLWWPRYVQFVSISALIWSLIACVVCSIPVESMKLFYAVAGILQILVILRFLMRKNKKQQSASNDPIETDEK